LDGSAAASALERFLQFAGDLVGRGLHRALHDLGGPGQRLVQPLFDGRLADRDESGLAGGVRIDELVIRPAASQGAVGQASGRR